MLPQTFAVKAPPELFEAILNKINLLFGQKEVFKQKYDYLVWNYNDVNFVTQEDSPDFLERKGIPIISIEELFASENEELERRKFEKWCKTLRCNLQRDRNGVYVDPLTFYSWAAWMTARENSI